MPRINFCQGELSEHVAIIGDGKSGKTTFARKILAGLPSSYTYWAYDYNHNGFSNLPNTTEIRDTSRLIDARVRYLPQVKDRKEMDAFCSAALKLGNRIAVLDEYHTQQNGRHISPLQARFLRTFRHYNGSWIVIAQSPLDLNEVIYNNADHLFIFYIDDASRHIDYVKKWFGKDMTAQLTSAPKGSYIHKAKGEKARFYNAKSSA